MILECRDLSKSFYTKKALNEVSLKLEGGKIYGLLGENGSGKTTWMKIISGLTKLHPERFCSRSIRGSMEIRQRSLHVYRAVFLQFSGCERSRTVL